MVHPGPVASGGARCSTTPSRAAGSATTSGAGGSCGSTGEPGDGGLRRGRGEADHGVQSAPCGGSVAWRTRWRLTWAAVPGARAYEVRFTTSEGPSGRTRVLDAPELALEVAAGTSPSSRVDQDRALQLALSAAQLQVQVAAVDAGGGSGPPSPWFAVGEVPAGGVPADAGEASARHAH